MLVSARVLPEVAEVMERSVGKPDLPNLAAVLQDACGLWALMEEKDA